MNKNATIYEEVPVLSSSLSEIGYISRTSTQGKEYLLVQDFFSFMNDKYKKYRNKKAMIFIEPQLETGFPDIVIAEYYSLPPNCWNDARGDLNTTDLKKSAIDHKSMYSKGIRDYIKSIDRFRSPSAYQGYHRLIVEFNDGNYANIEVRA